MSTELPCKIVKCEPGKGFWTYTPFETTELLAVRKVRTATLLTDGREISPEQRKHIYATLRDIGLWTGFAGEEIKAVMKYEYIARTGAPYFSLSDCDMTTAREFLTFLLDFCVENGIFCSDRLISRAPDIGRYVYACVANRVCCLTGAPADLHHVDAVGAGRDREEIVHLGMRVLPLCREKHQEAHTMGRDSFLKKYHLVPIKLDEYLCDILKIGGEIT